MQRTNTPTCLWDYACLYVPRIRNMTVNQHPAANGRTPYEIVMGETPDISEYASFSWYQLVWYLDNASFPESRKDLGRSLDRRLSSRWAGHVLLDLDGEWYRSIKIISPGR
jgi:hypothetical protein